MKANEMHCFSSLFW